LPGVLVPDNWNADAMKLEAEAFYQAIAPAQPWFSYGAAYAPALQSSLLSAGDIPYTGLKGTDASTILMNNLLTTQALSLYPPAGDPAQPGVRILSATFQEVAAHIAAAFPVAGAAAIPSVPADVTGTTSAPVLEVSMPSATVPVPAATEAAAVQAIDRFLLGAVPLLAEVLEILANKLNVVPPSGAMAGIWSQNDAIRGVWNAPANMSLNEVLAPMVSLSDDQQAQYNVPVNGNAIDILREMPGRGTVVWGARTLDGNSQDYRYIQVRRTLVYIEQSIKLALEQFAFAPNDGGTWAAVTAAISSFLTQLWQAGGLMGSKASEAFTVQCGVPTTMSGLDVLNGLMIVNVTLQMIHPAEFIELSFTQVMQGV
ncbi:MAG TPA: phage tail sheath C-terminal domain-containing protein, partial [Allosphingosinicella sp.]|nr:phage tail sheath C-terminal domain-containing protein [Allosphingosinicella sp.]